MPIPPKATSAAADVLEQLEGGDLETVAETALQAALPVMLADVAVELRSIRDDFTDYLGPDDETVPRLSALIARLEG